MDTLTATSPSLVAGLMHLSKVVGVITLASTVMSPNLHLMFWASPRSNPWPLIYTGVPPLEVPKVGQIEAILGA